MWLSWLFDWLWKTTETALEMYTFIENCKDKHLTLGDIKQLKPGDEIDVVIWDRNFEEYHIWKNAEANKEYDPETFFVQNRHQCVYLGDLQWEILFPYGETFTHQVHFNTETLEEDDPRWVPVKNGLITTSIKFEGTSKPKIYLWHTFPDTTRVGWRGPMMLWSHLSNMPKVFYVE